MHASIGVDHQLAAFSNKITINGNDSFGVGPELGIRGNRMDRSINFDAKPLIKNILDYSIIGVRLQPYIGLTQRILKTGFSLLLEQFTV
ncbi:MAG: hypothetical protein QM764_21870 [Chitinophagaceae bacterium]